MTIRVNEGQSLYDIALQYYGDISGFWWLIQDNNLSIESEVEAGQILTIRDEYISDKALYFRLTQKEINNSDYSITEGEPLALKVTEVKNETAGGNGSIKVSVTGGVPPYAYQWSNGATSKNLNNIGAGSYTLIVEDSDGAQVMVSVDVSAFVFEDFLTTKKGVNILTKKGNKIKLKKSL